MNRNELDSVIHNLHKQVRDEGCYTCNECLNDECTNSVIGWGYCKACLIESAPKSMHSILWKYVADLEALRDRRKTIRSMAR